MAAKAEFNVLLVSNVSADIFPNNTPSQFSTILANDITLPDGEWEVAVTNIMYPSHIASATKDDKLEIFKYKDTYRTLLPVPDRGKHESMSNRLTVNLSLPAASSATTKKAAVAEMSSITTDIKLDEHINGIFKKQSINNLLKLKVRNQKKGLKFILEVYDDDIVVILHPDVCKYLGFQCDTPFLRGTHWARSQFNSKAVVPKKENQLIILIDLRNQVQEHRQFKRSFQVDKGSKTTQVFYAAEVPLKFKQGKDDDLYWEPKLTMSMNPLKGTISFSKSKEIPADIAQFERSITFIRFDKITCREFNLEPIYIANFGKSSTFTINFTPVTIDKAKAVIVSEVDIYFEGIRELNSSMAEAPVATITIDSDKSFEKPSEYLSPLNKEASKYSYSFSYDEHRQRFSTSTGNETFLRLSPTLASILGFFNLTDGVIFPAGKTYAAESPVIDRAITSLYCYSNIVHDVYVGNVKAPLLLACPFKKDPKSNVTQLEFWNPTYRKLNRNNLHQIDIAVYDEAGTLVPFLFGKTVLNLHFRP